ncbi:hypothetical protein [Corynebacterium flavescens]|uniref:Uncharacterized protein n=1 Tax=Corynebacterium flavescens TaxID=28028 RepID=A0A1L7CNN2_CORFL|nr:hypothetical protein [Corynebacterium flavescens]APT87454.1 hypothetical protein CFLV_09935 [Corynebacterium flavescens]KAA8720549.1 hypothetical protein F4V60_09645 [Corynebacterium flavescens]GEB97679.1 hypothetical protein CFL01nite_11740 [Corynebacterium flavescens]
MNQIIECHHCGAVNVIPEGEYFGGYCECCSSDVYAAPEPEEDAPVSDYTPADSLTYLTNSAVIALDAAYEEIHDVNGEGIETEDLPDHLQAAAAIVLDVRKSIRREAAKHCDSSARTYSNGVPINIRYQGARLIGPDDRPYRPGYITTVHPNGTPDASIPPQSIKS